MMQPFSWNAAMEISDRHLASRGPFVVGAHLTLADIVIGVSVNRWLLTPFSKPEPSVVATYHELLSSRPGFIKHVRNALP